MSAPRNKRPFAGAASDPAQRQITSFFSSTASPSHPESDSANRKTHMVAPALPPAVQSNLLSVGMRVRKSVPEGYKTGSYGSFSLWSDATAPAKQQPLQSSPQPRAGAAPSHAARPTYLSSSSSSSSSSSARAASRELLPFCGIHSVGGMSCQPAFSPVPDLDDVPGLSSSQESAADELPPPPPPPPLAATTANGRKRFHGDDQPDRAVDDDPAYDGPFVWRHQFHDGEVSPRSHAPLGYENARVMAVPRSRRHAPPEQRKSAWEQENSDGAVVLSDDFPEAEFLQYRADMDTDSV